MSFPASSIRASRRRARTVDAFISTISPMAFESRSQKYRSTTISNKDWVELDQGPPDGVQLLAQTDAICGVTLTAESLPQVRPASQDSGCLVPEPPPVLRQAVVHRRSDQPSHHHILLLELIRILEDLDGHVLQDVLGIGAIHAHAGRDPPEAVPFPQKHAQERRRIGPPAPGPAWSASLSRSCTVHMRFHSILRPSAKITRSGTRVLAKNVCW